MRIEVNALSGTERCEDLSDVGVVFPAYNEERHVAEAVGRAIGVGVGRVVCVNDCSTDRTGDILDGCRGDPMVEVIHHKVNEGKQAAVKHGLMQALKHRELLSFATLDADMQHDPFELPQMMAPLREYDVVCAYRSREEMPLVPRITNGLVNLIYRLIAGIGVRDVQSGYRAYTREVAEFIAVHLGTVGRYTLEHTTMVLFGRLALERGRDFRIAEVPIRCPYGLARSHIRMKDNFQLAWASVRSALVLARMVRWGR